jgi:hypothetical protein
MNRIEDTTIEAVLEHLIADGAGGIGPAFTRMFELAMRLERERYLGAGHYERSDDRRGYANGYKPKRLDTPAGTRGSRRTIRVDNAPSSSEAA